MSKQGGSLDRGRRRRDEVPPVPPREGLTGLEAAAQDVLLRLVEQAGGRFDPGANVDPAPRRELADLLESWARDRSEPVAGGLTFPGRPGLWHALDELCPLQDPNRWDRLRQALVVELEARGWQRVSPPRGSAFFLASATTDAAIRTSD